MDIFIGCSEIYDRALASGEASKLAEINQLKLQIQDSFNRTATALIPLVGESFCDILLTLMAPGANQETPDSEAELKGFEIKNNSSNHVAIQIREFGLDAKSRDSVDTESLTMLETKNRTGSRQVDTHLPYLAGNPLSITTQWGRASLEVEYSCRLLMPVLKQ
jgi:hypothetical protein